MMEQLLFETIGSRMCRCAPLDLPTEDCCEAEHCLVTSEYGLTGVIDGEVFHRVYCEKHYFEFKYGGPDGKHD